MTLPWLAKLLPGPELPISEETVRQFIDRYWDFFGLDQGDPGKEALIKFCLEFGKEREKYTLKMIDPVLWAFINGFDNSFDAGYQNAYQAWAKWAKDNNILLIEPPVSGVSND